VLAVAEAGCSTSLTPEPGYSRALAARYCANFGTFDRPSDLKNGVLFVQVHEHTSDQTLANGHDLSSVSTWQPLGAALEDIGGLGPISTWDARSKSAYLAALPKIWRAYQAAGLNPKRDLHAGGLSKGPASSAVSGPVSSEITIAWVSVTRPSASARAVTGSVRASRRHAFTR
jgi:hypothetical protein